MIEEQGRILSLEPGAAWVETIRRSTCNSCRARAGCGQALLERLGSGARRGFIRVLCDQPLSVGDEVIIGLPEDAVLKASTLMYILPLFSMFIFAVLMDTIGMSEPWIVLAAACGLACGFVTTGWWAQRERGNPAYHARVLRHLPGGTAAPLLVRGSS